MRITLFSFLLFTTVSVSTAAFPFYVRQNHVVQESDSLFGKDQQLQEVQVVGMNKARQLQHQAYAVSVVDLKALSAQNLQLNKVLNQITSVRIREDGGLGSDYTFSMNGFSGNQVKFFLDGIPMDNFGSSFNIANLSANMADRVEIYKGVLPVYLGADALGGAVNIVTRQNANYLDATYAIGSFNTHRVGINGAYTNTKTGLTLRANTFFNYSKNNFKVYVPITDLSSNKVLENSWVKRFHDAYTSYGMKLETGVVRKSWADYLLFGFIVSGNDKEIQTGATMDAVYGGPTVKSTSIIPSVRWKKNDIFVDGLSLSIYGAYAMVNTHNVDTLSATYNWLGEHVASTSAGEGILTDAKISERQWVGNLTADYVINTHQSLSFNHTFSALKRKSDERRNPNPVTNNVPQDMVKNISGIGYQIRYNKWNANIFGKMYFLKTSTYQQFDAFKATERWEKVSSNNHNLGYGASATYYILPTLQVKTSFEQAYRLPEAIEIFGDGFIQKSNLNLKPEKSKNFNLGLLWDQRFGNHHVIAEVNYLYRYTTDFILKKVSLGSDPTTGYDNLGKVVTNGLEGSIKYEYKNLFHIGGNVTYQDIKDRMKTEANNSSYTGNAITESITNGQRLPNIPYYFMNGEVGFNFKDFGRKGNTLSLNYIADYVYKYYLSFAGLGARGSKKIIPSQFSQNAAIVYSMEDGKYNITLECTNFANQKLYDNYRLQKPGRAFNVKFRYFISK